MSDLRQELLTMLATTFDLDPAVLAENPTLEEAGLDSLSLVEFATAVERRHGIPLDEDELTGDQRVEDLLALLLNAQPARP